MSGGSPQLYADNGVMIEDGLNAVLESGRAGRATYYEQRVDDFHGDEVQCLSKAIADSPPGHPVSRRDIMSPLMVEYGDSEAKQLLQRFLGK